LYPMGYESNSCAFDGSEAGDSISLFLSANTACNVAVEEDYFENPHLYSSCVCSQLKTVKTSNLTVAPYTFVEANGPIFTPDYPTSSPYVTSVGATQFVSSGSGMSEIGASITSGAIITTGGGFSNFQAMPSFQKAAVSSYLSKAKLPPSFSFNTSNRAYPDVSFNGHNFMIFYSNNSNNQDKCPCASLQVDGTSCSSPSFTALISLLNSNLLNAGKSQLGPLNTLLYQMASESPSAFNDITTGSNRCNRGWCCTYGWNAQAGWDPVSGLGTPNYPAMLKYVMQAKGVY